MQHTLIFFFFLLQPGSNWRVDTAHEEGEGRVKVFKFHVCICLTEMTIHRSAIKKLNPTTKMTNVPLDSPDSGLRANIRLSAAKLSKHTPRGLGGRHIATHKTTPRDSLL